MDYNNQNSNNDSNQQSTVGQYSNQYSQPAAPQYSQQQYGQPQYSQSNYNQQGAGQYSSQQFGPQQPHMSSQKGNYSDPYAYQPQGQFNSPYNAPVQKPGPNGFQIASLIVGILSIVCCCWGLFSIILAIAGIILAIVGNKKGKHGVGTGGLVCSIIGLVLAVILFAFSYFTFISLPRNINDLNQWIEDLEDF